MVIVFYLVFPEIKVSAEVGMLIGLESFKRCGTGSPVRLGALGQHHLTSPGILRELSAVGK